MNMKVDVLSVHLFYEYGGYKKKNELKSFDPLTSVRTPI